MQPGFAINNLNVKHNLILNMQKMFVFTYLQPCNDVISYEAIVKNLHSVATSLKLDSSYGVDDLDGWKNQKKINYIKSFQTIHTHFKKNNIIYFG
jgi:hypothetical protein